VSGDAVVAPASPGQRVAAEAVGSAHVITVCDRAQESCPVWPGAKERIQWSFEDPAQVEGSDAEKMRAFTNVRNAIANRIRLFLNAVKIHPAE